MSHGLLKINGSLDGDKTGIFFLSNSLGNYLTKFSFNTGIISFSTVDFEIKKFKLKYL